MKTKRIIFLTGTRADFGKLKSLIQLIEECEQFENYVFVTGMHTLSKYGSTYLEVKNQNYKNMYVYMNQTSTTDMDVILANTIVGFGNFVKEIKPDMIIIHGDRVESLAGAIVGALNNILVMHIEGGEVSGTIDELIRHSISKLAHIHLVSNNVAKDRLLRMGERENSIHVIGSPDIDVMLSSNLPPLDETKRRYEIKFDKYCIFSFHPVTTHIESLKGEISAIIRALMMSNLNYVVIYPNNDSGSDIIIEELKNIRDNQRFRIFPSIRFEYYLTLLKNADIIIGNSSAGIREAEIYGVPSINIGDRQKNRSHSKNIINVDADTNSIIYALKEAMQMTIIPTTHFGDGDSSKKFFGIVANPAVWNTPKQKYFQDY